RITRGRHSDFRGHFLQLVPTRPLPFQEVARLSPTARPRGPGGAALTRSAESRRRLRPLRGTKISREPRIPMPAAAFWIGDGPSVPCGDIARCNKGCNPPYCHGLGQEWRVTLIRYADDFDLSTAYQHRVLSSRGQHI